MKIAIYIISLSLFFNSCKSGERRKIIKTWDNGKTSIERIYFSDKNSDYKLFQYNKDGSLELEGQYIDYKEEGTFNWYYSNGNKKWVETFKNGISIDTIYCYYESGKLKRKNFPPKNKTRKAIEYYETGEIKISSFLFNSENIDSLWIGYFKNQKIKEIGKVNKGKKVGIWKFFDKNGNLIDSVNQSGKNKFIFGFEEEEIIYELENLKNTD